MVWCLPWVQYECGNAVNERCCPQGELTVKLVECHYILVSVASGIHKKTTCLYWDH